MRRTEMPKICCEELFVTCANRIQSKVESEKLVANRNSIDELENGYLRAVVETMLHELPQVDKFWGVPNKTWKNLYKNHLLSLNGVARQEYDKLRLAPAGGICPFCSTGTVFTLDHVLPKKKFPRYAILVPNLVGCCRDCNTAKDQHVPSSEEEHLFHPYFESVEERWLSAEINEEVPPSVTYRVNVDYDWDEMTLARCELQFDLLDLGLRYASQAANELSTIPYILNVLLEDGDKDSVRFYLMSQAESARNAELPVEWKVALYEAAAESDWFCKGGFSFEV